MNCTWISTECKVPEVIFLELNHTAARIGRLSSFLKEELKMSTGLINRLKWYERILVNGNPQHTDFSVAPGDVITVLLEEPPIEYPAQDGPLTIVYEDEHILAVDKPADMLIHPSRAKNEGTLANFVAGYYEKTGQRSAFHPVTRLDRDTYGIVLLAKNTHIHALLQQGALQKTYHALTFGAPETDCGIIDAPIARRELPSLLRHISPEGKPSVTEFRVLERAGNCCLLALHPITGRTHQLRLHCFHMGFPILGDPQYCTAESAAISREMGLTHQLLLAHSLSFAHPITGAPMRLTTSIPIK